jgi:hypothetical protein
MYIATFRVSNYESFSSSEEIRLKPGFNVVVGQNNVGKTALAEALSLRFFNNPHRSLATVPDPIKPPISTTSQVKVAFKLDSKELIELLASRLPGFYVPIGARADLANEEERFLRAVSQQPTIEGTFVAGGLASSPLLRNSAENT